jgi:hypothetical protein
MNVLICILHYPLYLKTKKMKMKKDPSEITHSNFSENPSKNVFQRIQAGVQRMNKGKAKGLFRRKNDQGDKKKPGRRV